MWERERERVFLGIIHLTVEDSFIFEWVIINTNKQITGYMYMNVMLDSDDLDICKVIS